jgi:hypothetical protein
VSLKSEEAQSPPNTAIWDHNRGVIRSNVGGWIIGHGVMNRGYEMMDDFVGKLSYMQVVIFNVTGRIPERRLADWFEAVHICLSWPDPRIWCNQIGALGGSARASSLGSIVAGILATDARSYGIKPLLEGIPFIQRAKLNYDNGLSIRDIVENESKGHDGKPLIMGYMRPIAKGDERVPALERLRRDKGIPMGEHLTLAFGLNDYLEKDYSEAINVNGYVSAVVSDHGYTAEEVYRILSVAVASGVSACYIDSRNKPAEAFMPLQCEDVEYKGAELRPVPS